MVADIQSINVDLMRIHHEVDMNSEFRVKWPRGEIGALPDDAEQNMRLLFLEKQAEKHEQIIEEIRYLKQQGYGSFTLYVCGSWRCLLHPCVFHQTKQSGD